MLVGVTGCCCWGDAFTWYNAEASASSGYNGVFYNDGERMIFGDLFGVAASAV
jgi:hypothetical protein